MDLKEINQEKTTNRRHVSGNQEKARVDHKTCLFRSNTAQSRKSDQDIPSQFTLLYIDLSGIALDMDQYTSYPEIIIVASNDSI